MPHNGSGPSGHLSRPHRPERTLAIAVLGAILLLDPFLGLFDKGGKAMVWGIPLLYAYLFAAWSLIIILTAIVMESRTERTPGSAEDDLSGTENLPTNADRVDHRAHFKKV